MDKNEKRRKGSQKEECIVSAKESRSSCYLIKIFLRCFLWNKKVNPFREVE